MPEFRIRSADTKRVFAKGIQADLRLDDNVNCAQLLTREVRERRLHKGTGWVLQGYDKRKGWIDVATVPPSK